MSLWIRGPIVSVGGVGRLRVLFWCVERHDTTRHDTTRHDTGYGIFFFDYQMVSGKAIFYVCIFMYVFLCMYMYVYVCTFTMYFMICIIRKTKKNSSFCDLLGGGGGERA